MSVFHNIQITPKSNTLLSLKDVNNFIFDLVDNGLIEKEYNILTGESPNIQNITTWDFINDMTTSELVKDSKLEILKEKNIENLSNQNNYAFKIHLTKKSDVFKELDVFTTTDRQHFPLIIWFLKSPIDFILYKEDQKTGDLEQVTLININCGLRSSGQGGECLYGLGENQNQFEVFFEKVGKFMKGFEIGTYYD